jgi:hypothetical protein
MTISFGGSYNGTATLSDGFLHTETDVVIGLSASGTHTFTNNLASGSFTWTAQLEPTSNPDVDLLVGTVTINNLGIRTAALTGEVVAAPDGIAAIFWIADDPVFGPIGWTTYTSLTQPGQTYIAGTAGQPLTAGNAPVFLDGSGLQGQTITAGGGNDAVVAGLNDTISLGKGNDVVNAGDNSTITLGGGNDYVIAGANSTITLGGGTDTVIAGPNSTITLGKGPDTVTSGGNSTITVGNGNDTINVGYNDTVTVGKGQDSFVFAQTAAGSIGAVTINHFDTSKDLITLPTQLATAFSYQDNAQGNAVITVDNAGDTITLVGVHASALHPSDFHFA